MSVVSAGLLSTFSAEAHNVNLLDFEEISKPLAEEMQKEDCTVVTVTSAGATRYYVHKLALYNRQVADVSPNMVRDIHDFHKKFSLAPAIPAGSVSFEMMNFRKKFLEEELAEFVKGMEEADSNQMLDALVDLVYVAIGTAYLCNWPFGTAWQRVHAANMTKIRAERPEQSKRGTAFDVVKPKLWVSPNLCDLTMPIPSIDAITDASRPSA